MEIPHLMAANERNQSGMARFKEDGCVQFKNGPGRGLLRL